MDEGGGGGVELGAERGIAGVDPGEGGGVQPFADVLAIPGLPAWALAVTLQQAVGVDPCETIGLVGGDARAEPAGQLHAVGMLELLPVAHSADHFLRHRHDGGAGRSERRHRREEEREKSSARTGLGFGARMLSVHGRA
ncbi:MAG: hypothetical protein WCG26_10825 [Chloroflexales bacterium]